MKTIRLDRQGAQRKLDEIYERAAELNRLMDDGDFDTDDLIKFVQNLAAKEAP